MMKQSARWTLTVSSDIDRRVRRLLAATGRKGDLSSFVEEAVKSRLLEVSLKSVRAHSRPSANDVETAPEPDNGRIERQYGG
jgi:Ribbon-helix-helix domain